MRSMSSSEWISTFQMGISTCRGSIVVIYFRWFDLVITKWSFNFDFSMVKHLNLFLGNEVKKKHNMSIRISYLSMKWQLWSNFEIEITI